MVSNKVKLVIGIRIMLILRHIYVVIEGVEVVGKAIVAIKVLVCVLVITKVYGLEAVSKVSKEFEVFKVFKVSKVSKVYRHRRRCRCRRKGLI